jgi:peptidoglycan hydrolase-like protein with peptidoglycan-binding domain
VKRILATGVVLVMLPFLASADTLSELQAQIVVLTAQLAQLKGNTGTQAAPTTPPPPPYPITRTLLRGMQGEDVRAVQQFLISQGLLAADSVTGFFGPLTEGAVKAWQASNGIVSSGTPITTGYGSVGPRTRAAMAEVRPSAFANATGSSGTYAQGSYQTYSEPSYAREEPKQTNASCALGNFTVAHGASVLAYESSSVATGACKSEIRVCNKGVLSGSYKYSLCTSGVASYSQAAYNTQTIATYSQASYYSQGSYASGATMQTKVLALNLKNPWGYTTTHTEYVSAVSRLVTTIQHTEADIVGVQELHPDVFARLTTHLSGWSSLSINGDVGVFTRYKILGPAGSSGAKIQLPTGGVAYIFVVHLGSAPYQPYDIRDGNLTCNTVAVEQAARAARLSQTQAALNDAKPYLASGAPVFLVGDFNEPSHLDWTATAAVSGLHRCAVSWPTSKAMVDAGFVDTYRAARPNEVASPGITWTTQPAANEVLDRIDFVYADPASKVITSYTVGDGVHIPADLISAPYGGYWSDHAGVMSILTIKADFPGI